MARAKQTAILAALAAGLVGVSAAEQSFRTTALRGVRHYRYLSIERAEGQPDKRYRVAFDLSATASGSMTAVLIKAESAVGGDWTAPVVDSACHKALQGRGAELARVALAPLSPAAARLGAEFLALCAPAEYFFPLTDILNVSLIQTEPKFHLASLKAVGTSAHFEGFETAFERLGVSISARSPGGDVKLVALDRQALTVDWTPDPMQIEIVNRKTANTPEVTLKGVERYAFRLVIDPTSGALERATTTADDLDLVVTVPGLMPGQAPRLRVTREVTIETR